MADRARSSALWRSAGFAAAVVVLMCAAATVFGAHRSINAQRSAVERMFEQGVDGTGYSIAELLGDRVEYADRLVRVAAQYAGQNEALDTAAADLAAAAASLQTAEGAAACQAANEELTAQADTVSLLLQQMPLTELHERYRSEYVAELQSYDQRIAHLQPAYNEQVRTFNEEILGSFPLGTLARLTGVQPLEGYDG